MFVPLDMGAGLVTVDLLLEKLVKVLPKKS